MVWPAGHYHRLQVNHALLQARGLGLRAELTYEEWDNALRAANDKCIYCGVETHSRPQVDHFIPLCRGGHTVAGNCVPSCKRCNDSKNSQHPLEQDPLWWRRFARSRAEILAFVREQGGPIEPALLIYHRRGGPCTDGPYVNKRERVTCPACRAWQAQRSAPIREEHSARCETLEECLVQARTIAPDEASARYLARGMLENGWTKEDVLRFRGWSDQ